MQRVFIVIATGTFILVNTLNGVAYAGPAGTTLTGTKTAIATITQTGTYTWSLTKTTPTSTPYSIPFGTGVPVPFTITVGQNAGGVTSTNGPVSGSVCLTNAGTTASTSGLFLSDLLEYYNGTTWLPFGTSISIPISSELTPLQNKCYTYQFTGTSLSALTQYRNHATAKIDNFLGYEGSSHAVDIFAALNVTLVNNTQNASVNLTDTFTCPSGFTCTPSGPGGTLTAGQVINYTVTVTNNGATCGTTYNLPNAASIVTHDTHTQYNANATAYATTEACGCAATIGYWKNHLSLVAPVLPLYLGTQGGTKTLAVTTTTIAGNVLDQNVYGDASNGITKLYSQLLAAEIAIASGASAASISATITAANAFLALHNYLDWSSLSSSDQSQVLSWQTALANYNTGSPGGPPHC